MEIAPLTIHKNLDTVIDNLAENKICHFWVFNGQFIAEEMCDGYYQRTLTPEQVDKLICELTILRKEMSCSNQS